MLSSVGGMWSGDEHIYSNTRRIAQSGSVLRICMCMLKVLWHGLYARGPCNIIYFEY